uniref:Capsid protein n=1 Tax=Cressdnaviricota sp. TaxID=2748378 RepID=A0A8E8D8T0_9VIRU|nr:capsid protein [Cressdnaviricota sp.]
MAFPSNLSQTATVDFIFFLVQMAYGRRSSRRRAGRRGNRNLSTRRIFGNKSAKAQAKQIYALRKSVNRVRRRCQPEVKEIITPQNTVKAAAYTEAGINQMYHKLEFPVPVLGTGDNQRIGDKVRLLPTTLFLNGLYREITNSSNGIPLYNVITSKGCAMRIVAIQNRISANSTPSITSIFDTFDTTTNAVLTMSNINNPFKKGITTKYMILYDKVFYFNDLKPIKNLKLRIRPRIRSLRWEDDFTYPRGQVFVYVIFGGLQSTSNTLNEADYNQVEFTYWMKLPYTDA